MTQMVKAKGNKGSRGAGAAAGAGAAQAQSRNEAGCDNDGHTPLSLLSMRLRDNLRHHDRTGGDVYSFGKADSLPPGFCVER